MIPNWNGERWLPGCLDSVAAQTRVPQDVVVVDDGSTDGSRALLAARYPWARVVALERNAGFAVAANRGVAAARGEAVALVNTDVVLGVEWLARAAGALEAHPQAAAIATKMVDLTEPGELYDAGDVLRRDGVCEQRGRFERDDGRFDDAGDVFAACAGAALYRRSALLAAGGFDARLGTYLEDVDLGLRLRLAGWTCRYEPAAVARHAGGGSTWAMPRTPGAWVERNTLLLAAKAFPARWLPQLAYRQAAWARHAARERRLGVHLRGAAAALPLLSAMLRERRRLRRIAVVPIDRVVPARPIRGPAAGGHPSGRPGRTARFGD